MSEAVAEWAALEPAAAGRPEGLHYTPAVVAGALIAAASAYLALAVNGRQSLLFLVGAAAGVILYHAAFGFTSSWRHFIQNGRGDGLRAQMLMLAITTVVFFPLIGHQAFGQTLRGSVSPVGVSVLVGAFMFGIGMQLGGGCASGTLYTAGGGNTRMLVTLAAFIAGSVIGTLHTPWWSKTPSFKPISIVTTFGVWQALALSLAGFAAIAALTVIVERRKGPSGPWRPVRQPTGPRWSHGPWPLVAGAIGLAAVNIATLLIAGRPWGITGAFGLWGAKALSAAKVGVESWPSWSSPAQRAALHAPIVADATSVMDIGIMLGAMTAAGLAGRFAPAWRISGRSAATAVVGGLLLGYGARIAYGCNIGAYFSGIASGSVHGWVWLVAAFIGSIVGTRLVASGRLLE